MDDSQLKQVLALHTAYGSMMLALVHTLVDNGQLSPEDGAALIGRAEAALEQSGQTGALISEVLSSLGGMRLILSQPRPAD